MEWQMRVFPDLLVDLVHLVVFAGEKKEHIGYNLGLR